MTYKRTPAACRVRSARSSGFTLTETLIVISLIAIISVTSAVLIGSLMTADGNAGVDAVEQLSLARFAGQFRSDVHAANAAAITESLTDSGAPEPTVTLSFEDGRRAEYRCTAHNVELLMLRGQDVLLRDSYRLAGEKSFSRSEESGIVTFTQRVPTADTAVAVDDLQELPRFERQVDAALGWDQRHVKAADGDDE